MKPKVKTILSAATAVFGWFVVASILMYAVSSYPVKAALKPVSKIYNEILKPGTYFYLYPDNDKVDEDIKILSEREDSENHKSSIAVNKNNKHLKKVTIYVPDGITIHSFKLEKTNGSR